ncbi:MAG: Fe-S oxidoreductase [Anaerocolumna sp.]|nr:Fe-S oxidoreductase [Anaerocolumna sp.]
MKIVLTGINAKYIHTNLAIYSLRAYAKEYKSQIKLMEFTINNYMEDILQAIYKEKPDFLGFSCYIWNVAYIGQLCAELRKVLPNAKIWLGGPEVSYDAKTRLEADTTIDGIMIGEGEETFKEVLDYYLGNKTSLVQVITETGARQQLDFSGLPFPYEDLDDFENKIIYYESSRGCPYSCSYCLSSIDKRVRLRNLELVKQELQVFLDQKVPQVKFVDRTFNCNKTHAMGIWNYIKDHDNGVTNFHFEISADILEEEELKLLNTMREGLVQLEIGVQSTNPKTLNAIHRNMNMNKLKYAVNRIHEGRNIHQHLDLIAGLPYEDYNSFKESFCEVYALKPDQLQLGFLKVLKGSGMYYDAKEWGIVYKSISPFEVLFTNWITYDEIIKLKLIENMVEIYYNSGQFVNALAYMEHFFPTPFAMYEELGDFYEKNKLTLMSHSRGRRFEILIDFMVEYKNKAFLSQLDIKAFSDILLHDMYLRENLKSRPTFASSKESYKTTIRNFFSEEEMLCNYLNFSGDIKITPKIKANLHMEHYDINLAETIRLGRTVTGSQYILYDYMNRNPLNYQGRDILITNL